MSNVNVTEGTGKTVATESISSVEYQKIKLIDSTATSTTPTGVAANPLQVSIANSSGTLPVSIATNTPTGTTASGVSLTVNPLTIGGRGTTTIPTAVADGQVVNVMLTSHGKVVTSSGGPRGFHIQQQTTITASTSETTVLTGVASTFLDVYGVIITNSSATAVNVAFKDSTGGTERFRISIPATDTRGFMINSSNGHQQATVNNNWTATCSGSVSSVYITMFALKTS